MTKEEAVYNNQKLVYYCANFYKNYPYKDDLYQAGNMGIIKAYQNYNPTQDCKFSTYAFSYICGEMSKLVREDKGIKISRQISKINLMIEKASILLSQTLMRNPSISEIANYLEIDEYLVAEAINSTSSIKSMDEPVNEEGNFTLQEVIGYSENIDDLILLKENLLKLNKDEQELIKNRYMNDLTQTETSNLMHMTQVQVSRREQKILQKLRDKMLV